MDDKNPVDTLRLSQADRHRLLKRMDERQPLHKGQCRRSHPRYLCEFRADPIIKIRQYGGQELTYISLARDLSASGMGFIHGCYLYPSTAVRVTLTALDGEKTSVEGQVVRCEHVEGRFHEVGIKFANPVDTHMFITIGEDETIGAANPATSEAMKTLIGLAEAVNSLKSHVAKSAKKDQIQRNLEQVCDLFTQARMQILGNPE